VIESGEGGEGVATAWMEVSVTSITRRVRV
jgi:hypothetical protein